MSHSPSEPRGSLRLPVMTWRLVTIGCAAAMSRFAFELSVFTFELMLCALAITAAI